MSETPQPTLAPGTRCQFHAHMLAKHRCGRCGLAICAQCSQSLGDGPFYCPSCAPLMGVVQQAPTGVPPPIERWPGVMCALHHDVPATQVCEVCRTRVCNTCDFQLPGNIHLCPTCATTSDTTLSPRRKRLLAWSYSLAAFATFGMVLCMSGVFAGTVSNEIELQILGTMIMIFVLGPALGGMGTAFGAHDKRLHNPLSVWVALIWNCLLVGAFLLMMVVGMMAG